MIITRLYDPDPSEGGGGDSTPPAYTPPTLNMAEAIPPEYRDKPYFKDKDFVGLIKDHVNLQTLLGQPRIGVPKDDAPEDDWGKFLGTLRPKTLDEYVFPETEFSKAGKRNDGFQKAVREMALEVGVPKRQFSKFVERVESHLMEAEKINAQQTKEREAEFEALLDKTYAKNKQEVLDRTKKLMVESVPEEMKAKVQEGLKNVPNDVLFALTSVLNGVHEKYLKEDAPPGGDFKGGGESDAALQAEAEKIMASDEYKDFRRAGHEAAKVKVKELFAKIAAIRAAGKKS